MVEIGSKTSRTIIDFKLSRYACYLIVQNADPKKQAVALGQTYFAIQTGMMPEDMPTPKKSLKELEREKKLEEIK